MKLLVCLVFSHCGLIETLGNFPALGSLELALQMCTNVPNFGGVISIKTLYHFQCHGGEISCHSGLSSPA